MTIVYVFAAAVATTLATGLGALPFVFFHSVARRWVGIGNAVAGGAMLAAAIELLGRAVERDELVAGVGAAVGAVTLGLSRRALRRRPSLHVSSLAGADAAHAATIIGVLTVNSFAEGLTVGVSFGGGHALGSFSTVAIALLNVPQGLAISLALVPEGASVRSAVGWSIFSSLPQPLVAVPAYAFVEALDGILPAALGLAAGALVTMVVAELVPDAREDASRRTVLVTLAATFGATFAVASYVV